MRVPDFILQSVGILSELRDKDSLDDVVDNCATGFIVGIRSRVARAFNFWYFITAKHAVEPLLNRPVVFLANGADGSLVKIEMFGRWFFHPTDNACDVAIHPVEKASDVDILAVHEDLLLPIELHPKTCPKLDIGIGDDVYMPSLFSSIAGFKHFRPIVRHGNIAMLPTEQIQARDGFTDIYLIEVRSIGGISGSPVFVRPTLSYRPSRKSDWFDVLARFHFVLGMVRSHWDIDEAQRNLYNCAHDSKRGVNMGIAIVTPSFKIIETLYHPDLVKARETFDNAIRQSLPD